MNLWDCVERDAFVETEGARGRWSQLSPAPRRLIRRTYDFKLRDERRTRTVDLPQSLYCDAIGAEKQHSQRRRHACEQAWCPLTTLQ